MTIESPIEEPTPNPYLAAAQQGKNDWWRYLLGYFFIIGS